MEDSEEQRSLPESWSLRGTRGTPQPRQTPGRQARWTRTDAEKATKNEKEKEESNELAKENETTEKESRRDKETHVLGVEDLGRHHGLSDPLEFAQPLHHDLVDSGGLPPPTERHQAGPEVVQQAEEDPEKERMKETESKAKEDSRRGKLTSPRRPRPAPGAGCQPEKEE